MTEGQIERTLDTNSGYFLDLIDELRRRVELLEGRG